MPSENEIQFQQIGSFGDLSASQSIPKVAISSHYNISKDVNILTTLGGSALISNGKYTCICGTTAGGAGAILSKRLLEFVPGQGQKSFFTAMFTQGVALTEQFAGLSNLGTGSGFGFNGEEFGTLVRYDGIVEIQELTITTPASGSENASITVDWIVYTVALTAGTAQLNARQIALSLTSQVDSWTFDSVDNQVVAVAIRAISTSNTFSFTSSAAVAAWAQTRAGETATDLWTPQSEWNEFPMPRLDPTKMNNYKIQVGPYVIYFSVLDAHTNYYRLVHVDNFNNVLTGNIKANPVVNHIWYALNRGSAESVECAGDSAGLYGEGIEDDFTKNSSIKRVLTAVSTTPVHAITIKCRQEINGRLNLARATIKTVTVSSDTTKPIIVSVFRDAILTAPVFQYVDKNNSVILSDIASTAVTGGSGITESGINSIVLNDLNLDIYAGESVTVIVSVAASPASDFTVTITYSEKLL